MKNHQTPEPRRVGSGQALDVHSIFNTIQGEGPFAGMPATFVRLAGCNLQCPLCDTEYTEGRRVMNIDEIVAKIGPTNRLVVITGGEPFRQDIEPLVSFLSSMRYQIQIETNGKFDCGYVIPMLATIVVSPKTSSIHSTTAFMAHAYKYVVRIGEIAEDGLPITALDHPVRTDTTVARPPAGWTGIVYVQPADEQDDIRNEENMNEAVSSVMMSPGERRLCLQLHKIAGLD